MVVVSIGSAWGDLRRRGRREHVWLVDERGALHGLNVATSEVDETVSGFEWPAGGFPDPSAELDPAQLVVWIANYQDSVTRVDLAASTGGGGSPLEADQAVR